MDRSQNKSFWILGAGKFGKIAYERLAKKFKKASFIIVDEERESFPKKINPDTRFVVQDVIFFMEKWLPFKEPDWIVPATPIHVVYLWLLTALKLEGMPKKISIPSQIDGMLPGVIHSSEPDTIYASYAKERCPNDCREGTICPLTGEKRPRALYRVIKEIKLENFKVEVVQSYQLSPGVGGIRPRQLWQLLANIRSSSGNFLIATACRCHGVISALEFK